MRIDEASVAETKDNQAEYQNGNARKTQVPSAVPGP
jgi:hypothetical protein